MTQRRLSSSHLPTWVQEFYSCPDEEKENNVFPRRSTPCPVSLATTDSGIQVSPFLMDAVSSSQAPHSAGAAGMIRLSAPAPSLIRPHLGGMSTSTPLRKGRVRSNSSDYKPGLGLSELSLSLSAIASEDSSMSVAEDSSTFFDAPTSQRTRSSKSQARPEEAAVSRILSSFLEGVNNPTATNISPQVRAEAEEIIDNCLKNLSRIVSEETPSRKANIRLKKRNYEMGESKGSDVMSIDSNSEETKSDEEDGDDNATIATYTVDHLGQATLDASSFHRVSQRHLNSNSDSLPLGTEANGRDQVRRLCTWMSELMESQFRAQVLRLKSEYDTKLRVEVEKVHQSSGHALKEHQSVIFHLQRQLERAARDFVRMNEVKGREIRELSREKEELLLEREQASERELNWERERMALQKRHTTQLRQLVDKTSSRLLQIQDAFQQQVAGMVAHIAYLQRENELLERRLQAHKVQLGLITVDDLPAKDQCVATDDDDEMEFSGNFVASSTVRSPAPVPRKSFPVYLDEEESRPNSADSGRSTSSVTEPQGGQETPGQAQELGEDAQVEEDAVAITARLSTQLRLLESTISKSFVPPAVPSPTRTQRSDPSATSPAS